MWSFRIALVHIVVPYIIPIIKYVKLCLFVPNVVYVTCVVPYIIPIIQYVKLRPFVPNVKRYMCYNSRRVMLTVDVLVETQTKFSELILPFVVHNIVRNGTDVHVEVVSRQIGAFFASHCATSGIQSLSGQCH